MASAPKEKIFLSINKNFKHCGKVTKNPRDMQATVLAKAPSRAKKPPAPPPAFAKAQSRYKKAQAHHPRPARFLVSAATLSSS